MSAFMIAHENYLRLSIFILLLMIFFGLERIFPRRPRSQPWVTRDLINCSLALFSSLFTRLFLALMPLAYALTLQKESLGLLNQLDLLESIHFGLGFLGLDLLIYVQHRLFHQIPLLWRLHRVHHTDLDLDVTTAIRFHPLEIGLSLLLKLSFIRILGASPFSVLIFEIVLNATALFNHSNIFIPAKIEQVLRLFLVTPDMHRIHHSINPLETNSNYSFNFSLWDRLFKSYRAEGALTQEALELGLQEWRNPKELGFLNLLIHPFLKK